MIGIAGKRVLITGGCGDIGRAVAKRFLDAGAQVVIGDRISLVQGTKLARTLSSTTRYVCCDVTKESSIQNAMTYMVKHFDGIDIAISNAGFVKQDLAVDVNLGDWQHTLDVNLTGSFLFARAAGRMMMANPRHGGKQRGVILFTGSWVQHMPWPESISYCASKGGQEMVMKVLAQELAGRGITCNIVAPGLVNAGLTRGIYVRDAKFRRRVNTTVPLRRMCSAEEVAGAFVFLASDDAAYITGCTLLMDGGATLVNRDA